ncbi:interleukin-18 receptor 1 [Hyperolius riggenbachi]|uniref:interleukin-18 receptor 1 n=1 Tax=Hyperolius riggenbachi TaxID=752182 RepID=UPI0035A28200
MGAVDNSGCRNHDDKKFLAVITEQYVQDIVYPKIKGVENPVVIEVEIGQNQTIICEASVVNDLNTFYWIQKKSSSSDDLESLLDDCTDVIDKTCTKRIRLNEEILVIELYVINISADDIKHPYDCILTTADGTDTRKYVLKLKDKSWGIPRGVFTTSIIASISSFISIVFLFGLCIYFRIEIVLLYRKITGLDETIGDSKEYDAYISLESHSSLQGEERKFAFCTLAPILENCFGFKLCLFERDVIPGGAIADDIHAFLEKSRRLIIVISKNYTSGKAMYEFESGLHKAMVERKIKVILVEFTPLSELSVVPESLQLLKTRNKVRWEGAKSHPLNSRFWKRIQYLMPAKPTKTSSDFHSRQKKWTLI